MNKFFLTKSLLKTCEFIVDDECMVSPIYRMLKDFQYFTSLRVGDITLKEYFIKRSKIAFNETYNIIGKTAYKDQFESLVNISTNRVKEVGWYYRV